METIENAELTGNHYVSVPHILRADAGITAISALHAGLGGIVAWRGDPLLRVRIGRNGGVAQPLTSLRWQRLDRWIPQAKCDLEPGLTVTVTICTPGGYEPLSRGGFIQVEVENRTSSAADIDIVVDARMLGADLQVARPRTMHSGHHAVTGALHPGIAFECGSQPTVAALGFCADGGDASFVIQAAGGAGDDDADSPGDVHSSAGTDREVSARPGELIAATMSARVRIRAGRTARRAFFFGVGRDADSALAHAAHLAGIGAPSLLRQARLELAQLARRAPDVALSELLNRNLLFNHYYALARAFDDDRLYAVASRSPRHRPGALVNERELLFWTLPAIMMTDPLLARELLRDSFEVYSAQPGLRLRYLDGGVFEPGFCLEHVLLYPLAVDRYVTETGDDTLLDDPLIQDVLREIDSGLDSRLGEDVLLCSTEVLPGGERSDQPYPTLGNILVWAYASALPRIWRAEPGDQPATFDGAAEDIASAIWQRCMADVGGAQVFVSSTDLSNRSAVYDDPAMSLSLIPFFGFCPPDDSTYRDTLALLRSKAYPFWKDGVVPGLASRHHPEAAALAALCTDLLGPRRDKALASLRRLQLDDGIACDLYDPATGRSAGGVHAAALAGLLAWSLMQALEGPPKRSARKQSR